MPQCVQLRRGEYPLWRISGRDGEKMAEVSLLEPDDRLWTDTLARVRHDVYHLPEYVRIDAGLSGGTPAAFRYAEAGHVLLLPLVLRPVPDTDLRDAISPYGYPGPVSDAGPDFW